MTPIQQETYEFLKTFFEEYQRFPSVREIQKRFKLNSPAPVQQRMEQLKRKGFIDWEPGKARAIQLTGYRAKLEKIEA